MIRIVWIRLAVISYLHISEHRSWWFINVRQSPLNPPNTIGITNQAFVVQQMLLLPHPRVVLS